MRPLAALLLGILAAAAVFWRFGVRGAAQPRNGSGERDAPVSAPARAASQAAARPQVARAPAGTGKAALAKQREIDAMSPSFRETSFLIAIRRVGYECDDVIGADPIGADPAGNPHKAWRVTCREAAAYLVGIDAAGRLEVEPTPYAEGQPFNVIEPGAPPLRGPVPRPPPRPQP